MSTSPSPFFSVPNGGMDGVDLDGSFQVLSSGSLDDDVLDAIMATTFADSAGNFDMAADVADATAVAAAAAAAAAASTTIASPGSDGVGRLSDPVLLTALSSQLGLDSPVRKLNQQPLPQQPLLARQPQPPQQQQQPPQQQQQQQQQPANSSVEQERELEDKFDGLWDDIQSNIIEMSPEDLASFSGYRLPDADADTVAAAAAAAAAAATAAAAAPPSQGPGRSPSPATSGEEDDADADADAEPAYDPLQAVGAQLRPVGGARGARRAVLPVYNWPQSFLQMERKQFVRLTRSGRFTKEQVQDLRQARRREKSRTYSAAQRNRRAARTAVAGAATAASRRASRASVHEARRQAPAPLLEAQAQAQAPVQMAAAGADAAAEAAQLRRRVAYLARVNQALRTDRNALMNIVGRVCPEELDHLALSTY